MADPFSLEDLHDIHGALVRSIITYQEHELSRLDYTDRERRSFREKIDANTALADRVFDMIKRGERARRNASQELFG